ncbi:MAG TPA: 50S ribosomal protein L25 [Ktedonobacterales bacterium]|nr:50S ribosomal protein L25 [Ktedonobacterales bacterium]
MAAKVSLEVAPRTTLGKQVKQLRRQGIIPANLYGRKQPSQALQVDLYTLDRFLAGHAATRVIDLQLGGRKGEVYNALIRHVARSPRSGKILHVDFLRVSMNEPIVVRVPVTLKGTAPAVAVEGGVLLHLLDTLEIESLPGDIPEALELDINGLAAIDDSLRVSDVPLPRGVTLLSPADEPVVKVVAPRAVLAEEAAEAAAAEEKEAAAPAAEEGKSEEGSD